ncbi:MAG: LacI family DNA-binding transcriptional regulator [Puniceicoccales bacterium]
MSSSPKRPTQSDVAKASGYSRPTVSLALKGDPIVSRATRERIRQVADSIGYVPDPLLSALSKYRNDQAPQSYKGTLAWVCSSSTNEPWSGITPYYEYYLGACEQAKKLGYNIEEIDIQREQLSSQRLDGILSARGTHGILLCPPVHADVQYELPWEQYSIITFGYSVTQPNLHRSSSSHYRATKRVYHELRKTGHHRIGFVFSAEVTQKTQDLCLSAYLCESYKTGATSIPSLVKDPISAEDFKEWYDRYRPDAAIISAPYWQSIQSSPVRIPEDISIASPMVSKHNSELSGILEKCQEIGAAAVDTVVQMIEHDIRGIPEDPKYILLEGDWNEGKTIRPRI